MKTLFFLMLLFISAQAEAQQIACGDSKHDPSELLTGEQLRASTSDAKTSDPVVLEIRRAERKLDDEPKAKPVPVSWAQAKQLVLLGLIETTIQAHDLTVVLVSKSGRVYSTKEPRIDEIYKVANVVDPCRRYMRHITE